MLNPISITPQKNQTSFGCSSCELGQEIVGTLTHKGIGRAEAERYVELKSPNPRNPYGYIIDFKNKQNFDHKTSIRELFEYVQNNLGYVVQNMQSLIK